MCGPFVSPGGKCRICASLCKRSQLPITGRGEKTCVCVDMQNFATPLSTDRGGDPCIADLLQMEGVGTHVCVCLCMCVCV